ncbi:hypothetical protein H4R24_002375 [Coemansia sp. RSA 988]|nr:hypothetical protein H4R24_002375 [Coemansia sp. RSA 988]
MESHPNSAHVSSQTEEAIVCNDERVPLIEPAGPPNDGNIVKPPADMVYGIAGKLNYQTILACVAKLFESLSYNGASFMYVEYLQTALNTTKPQSVALNRISLFITFTSGTIGAFISDHWLGKFKTIIFFAVSYVIGYSLLAISSTNISLSHGFGLTGFCIAVFMFISPSVGGIAPNMPGFVVEQIPIGYRPTTTPGIYEASSLTVERAMRYCYWFVNIGSSIGLTLLPLIAIYWSFPMAYTLAAFSVAIGYTVMASGSKHYTKVKPQSSALKKVWRCVCYARRHKRQGQAHFLDSSLGATGQEWNDEFVFGLQRGLRACKVFMFYPIYWVVNMNISDNLINQALAMRRPDWLSVSQIALANPIIITIAIPVVDHYILPLIRRLGFRFGPIARITTGFAIAFCCSLYVAILQKAIYLTGPYYDFTGPEVPYGAFNDISIWFEIVSYGLFGISEVFAATTGFEFACTQAPEELRSLFTALYMLSTSVGSIVGIFFAKWGGDPQVFYLFVIEAVLMGATTVIFYFSFRHYDKMIAE